MKRIFMLIAGFVVFYSCTSDSGTNVPSPSPETDPESLRDKLKQHPDSLLLVYELIEAYRNEGMYDSAIHLTQTGIKKDRGNAYWWNILAALYYENNDTTGAIRALQEAIDIYPLPDYLAALGKIYAQTNNEKALDIADELIATGQDKYVKNGYFIKGFYFNHHDYPQIAIAYMDSAIHLDYTFMYAYREKAIALYELKNYKRAISVLERAVTLQNNFDEGYFWLGKNYEALKDTAAAISSYENALLYDRDFLEAREALEKLKKQ